MLFVFEINHLIGRLEAIFPAQTQLSCNAALLTEKLVDLGSSPSLPPVAMVEITLIHGLQFPHG